MILIQLGTQGTYDVFNHIHWGCFTGTGAIPCAKEVALIKMGKKHMGTKPQYNAKSMG